jgi:hypothetical protein
VPQLISWLAEAGAQLLGERAQSGTQARELVDYFGGWQVRAAPTDVAWRLLYS